MPPVSFYIQGFPDFSMPKAKGISRLSYVGAAPSHFNAGPDGSPAVLPPISSGRREQKRAYISVGPCMAAFRLEIRVPAGNQPIRLRMLRSILMTDSSLSVGSFCSQMRVSLRSPVMGLPERFSGC